MRLTGKSLLQISLLTPFLFLTASISSVAATLTFEDLTDPATESLSVPDGYGGILWSAGGWQYYAEAQPPYAAHSGLNRIFSYAADNTFTFLNEPVYFDGAWFARGSGTNDTVQFQLFREGSLVHTSSSLYLTGNSTYLSSGYSGLVDAVSIAENPVVRPDDTDFVLDDLAFRSASSVPEPGTTGLLVIGFGTAMYLLKRKSIYARLK